MILLAVGGRRVLTGLFACPMTAVMGVLRGQGLRSRYLLAFGEACGPPWDSCSPEASASEV